MNTFLVSAGLFMLCAIMNLINVFRTGNGFGLVLGAIWLAASFLSYQRYRKAKLAAEEKENSPEEEAK